MRGVGEDGTRIAARLKAAHYLSMTKRDQEQPFNLEQFQRSLKLLTPDPNDEGALEIMRMYLPVANGDAQPNEMLMTALNAVAGGLLYVGIMPVRSKGGVPDERDLRWCERLVGSFSVGELGTEGGSLRSRFLADSRARKSSGKLRGDQASVLDAAAPGWVECRGSDDHFRKWLHLASEHFVREGALSRSIHTPEGRWLANQLNSHRRGTMAGWRRSMLNSELPGWDRVRWPDDRFDKALDRAADFRQRTGKVPSNKDPGAHFVSECRRREKSGTLSDRKIEILDDVLPGWRMIPGTDIHFENTLLRIQESYSVSGKLPTKSTKDGAWLGTRRQEQRRGKLSPKRKQMLDLALPGWVDANDLNLRFDNNLAEALKHYEDTGEVPKGGVLGRWLGKQRTQYYAGTLPPEREERLNSSIPGWSQRQDLEGEFDKRLAGIAQHIEAQGSLPSRGSTDGSWLAHQRKKALKGELSTFRNEKLNASIPGWEEIRDADTAFGEMLDRIAVLIGNKSYLPKSSTQEGQWLSNRRSDFRRGTLSPERKAKLDEAFPLWLDPKAWRESLKQEPQ